MRYVAGFLFNSDGTEVVLIHKKKGPPAVIGKWNAIGGKIEQGESPIAAMTREGKEEAGVSPTWNCFLVLSHPNHWSVEFFEAYDDEEFAKAMTFEQEEIQRFFVHYLPDVVANLQWIIPMALTHKESNVDVYDVAEVLVEHA